MALNGVLGQLLADGAKGGAERRENFKGHWRGAGITPLRHVPIWDGSKRTLYDLAAYIAQMVEALKTNGPLPDLASFKMEKLAPLSL